MRGDDRARLRWFPNRLPDGGNPYGIPLEDPTPPSMVLNPNHYATWPVGRDDGAQLIRHLLYHLRSTFVTMICIEGRDCDTLSDDQLHRMANGFCYGGATGRVAERLALAYDLCKCLRTHLSFDDVQSFMQTPDRRLDGKTPLQALSTWPVAKARRALQPVMMEHLVIGVANAAVIIERQRRQAEAAE